MPNITHLPVPQWLEMMSGGTCRLMPHHCTCSYWHRWPPQVRRTICRVDLSIKYKFTPKKKKKCFCWKSTVNQNCLVPIFLKYIDFVFCRGNSYSFGMILRWKNYFHFGLTVPLKTPWHFSIFLFYDNFLEISAGFYDLWYHMICCLLLLVSCR